MPPKTMDTMHTPKIKSALERMRSSINGRLDGYQHEGVRWMLFRELESEVPSGILADDMGTLRGSAPVRRLAALGCVCVDVLWGSLCPSYKQHPHVVWGRIPMAHPHGASPWRIPMAHSHYHLPNF